MGASESTARPNATNNEEEDNSQQQNSSSVGSYIGAAAAVATAAVGVAVAVHGISKMLSDNTDNQQRAQNEIERSSWNSPNLIAAGPSGMMRYRSKWSPPPAGRFKMNTDGGCHPVVSDYDGVERGPSGYGGILRDHHGNWVQGFIGFIGKSDCLTSEFHGILKGLEVLEKLKLKKAILETDCQSAYAWVTRQDDHRGKSEIIRACWPIIIKCRQLADKNKIAISLVTRDYANQCADKLAKMAIKRKELYVEIKTIQDVPYELRKLVGKDANFNV